MVKRLALELFCYLALTLAGIGLVLITLTDQVLEWAIWISIASIITHLIGVAYDYRQDQKDDEPTTGGKHTS